MEISSDESDITIVESIEDLEAQRVRLYKTVSLLEKQLSKAKAYYKKVTEKLTQLKTEQAHNENKRKAENLKNSLDSEWIDRQFEWSEKVRKLLKEYFKFDSFRPKQLAAINGTLSKKDVLLVMPTGGGKSLVYQLPALLSKGFTVVISPLISLIEDQLIALRSINVEAATVNGSTSKENTNKVFEQMLKKESKMKLLYVTPEWVAKSKRFMSTIKKAAEQGLVSRVAIDEVHCCSSWGHDFRPDYKYLGILRTTLPNVPFIGLTATATMNVLTDVQTMLNMENSMIITAPFNRPNLYYKVISKPSSKEGVLDYVENLLRTEYKDQTGIIYTTTVSDSTNLATDLRKRNLKVAPYHAQLEADDKRKIHNKWIEKTYQVIIATVAFGMGIDKPDVRFVIHHSLPKSMESLYQESGRAGRDGKQADCIIMFSLSDYLRNLGMVTSLVEEKKVLSVLEYCLDAENCRRALIATHFEETWDKSDCKQMCDHCNKNRTLFHYNIKNACLDLHTIIDKAADSEEKLTVNKLLDGWLQTGPKKLRVASLQVPKIERHHAEKLIAELLLKKYISIDKGYNTYSTICYMQVGNVPGPNEVIKMTSHTRFPGFPNCDFGQDASGSQHRENSPPAKKIKTKP